MKFSLCYTSRRASLISAVIETWLREAADPSNVEVVVAIDQDYRDGKQVADAAAARWPNVKSVVNTGSSNCVSGWNAAAAACTGDVLISLADDFFPPNRWDDLLRQSAPGEWWKEDHVVVISDGYNHQIFTLGIITRFRYERFGYFFYPGYESLFSDTELTAVAIAEKVVVDARHILFEHLHPDAGKRQQDEVDLNHASQLRWKRGETLFNFRRDTGFPIDRGPVADALALSYEELDFAVCIQAIKDDFCLAEVVKRLLDSPAGGARAKIGAVFIYCPDEYWDGRPRPLSDLAEITQAIADIADARVRFVDQAIAPFRAPGRSRIQVETHARNSAVTEIRKHGYSHIIIVDGDELWDKTLFGDLADFVKTNWPSCVYTGMVPVIGLPGYPVVDALDKATIYIGPQTLFSECRGIHGFPQELPGNKVTHFTATRRTREEIIAKMFASGHADDPNYDFKGWVDRVLPNIRPGFSYQFSPTSIGLHMYRPYQIWKACREWTSEEFEAMPDSLKPYMARPE